MLQLRQLYAQVGLTDRIQELPDAPGTVASRPDKSGHHGCTPKVHWVTDSFPINFFAVQQRLQCLSELVIRHGFQPDSAQSHCLPALFIDWIFVGCFGLLPGSLWCRVLWHWFFFFFFCRSCYWKQFRGGWWTQRGEGVCPPKTFLGKSLVRLCSCYSLYLVWASFWGLWGLQEL